MVKDDHMTGAKESPAPRGVTLGTAVMLLAAAAVLTVVAVVLLPRLLLLPVASGDTPPKVNEVPDPHKQILFKDWPKPDFVLVLSGEQHGYVLPCGCSEPQKGGLERRYNLLEELKGGSRNWPVVAVDLGDIPQNKGPVNLPNVQGNLKYVYSMRALKKMGYSAVGIGEYEAAAPLEHLLDSYALNEQEPRVLAGNLMAKPANLIPQDTTEAVTFAKIPNSGDTVGVVALVGASVAGKVKHPQLTFDAVKDVLPKHIKALNNGKPKLKVLLYQGTDKEAIKLAGFFKDFNVILCLSDSDEPPAGPVNSNDPTAKTTMIVSVGHKGKHVGVVGLFAKGDGVSFDMRYQMVTLNPEYKTKANKEADHPILKLMEEYTKELKNGNYLAKYIPVNHPLQAGAQQPADPKAVPAATPYFIGSATCEKCHDDAYKVWKHTPHSHAYQTLVNVKNPSNRQFDGECIVCHTVGFGYKTGYPEESPPNAKGERNKLTDVGCESCHGPCSEHVKKPANQMWYPLINPFKHVVNEQPAAKAVRTLKMDKFCQKCHDEDNDVHWDFEKKWPKIVHHTP